jgi:endonuclease III
MNRTSQILRILKSNYPIAKTSLRFKTPFQLLVSTILSAQCTDARVNLVTQELFKEYKTPKDLASISQKKLEQLIRSTGFYKNKAKSIKESSKTILERFHGKVPNTMGDILQLRGVARKTANVVLQEAFNITVGIVTDTHCIRVSQRLDLTKNKDPKKIEQDLMKIIPKKDWKKYGMATILHGRKICKATAPLCTQCPLNKICQKIGVTKFK